MTGIALFSYTCARFNQNCMKTLNNDQNEDVREAFLSTLSPLDRFQREVADLLIDVLEIFRKEVSVRETAELIANQ